MPLENFACQNKTRLKGSEDPFRLFHPIAYPQTWSSALPPGCLALLHTTHGTQTQRVISHQKKILLEEVLSGPKSSEDWLKETPMSGWGSIWELSSFVLWFFFVKLQDVSGTGLERARDCEFRRKSSSRDVTQNAKFSLTELLEQFLCQSPFNFYGDLCKIFFLYSRRILVVPGDIFLVLPINCC